MMDKRYRGISSILDFFEYADYEQWESALKSIAANSPKLCYDLLTTLCYEEQGQREDNPFKEKKKEVWFSNKPMNIAPREEEDKVERIVSSWAFADGHYSREVEWDIETILRHRLGRQALEALRNFLYNSDEATVQDFVDSLMSPDDLAERASAKIIIKPMTDMSLVRGNTGFFVIYTQKDDSEPIQLKFLHQVSAVFYLMYLIDHVNRQHGTGIIDLRRNRDEFTSLYQSVYDINRGEAYNRYEQLLFRENRHGEIRAGRVNEVIYDIKKHVSQAFTAYDESCRPYVMTARSHLTVSSDRIHFEDEAKGLLATRFM